MTTVGEQAGMSAAERAEWLDWRRSGSCCGGVGASEVAALVGRPMTAASSENARPPRQRRWTIRNWAASPGMHRLKVCPLCGLDVSTVGLTALAYTFEVVENRDGIDYLGEQLWHRECLVEHDYESEVQP